MHKHETEIETKIHEETKPIAEVLEKMAEEFAASIDNTKPEDLHAAGMITDMIKDLAEAKEKIVKACYYKAILCKMEEEEKEEEEEDRYMLKRFKEEYGEEDGERRYYDNYRYANGRFAPKGRGSYEPRRSGRRRGYQDSMIPLDYEGNFDNSEKTVEERMRDLDKNWGRMYYTPTNATNSTSMRGSNRTSENSGQTYADGYSAGQTRGYSEGYERGRDEGRRSGNNSQSRSDRMRRNYTENKHINDNSPEGKKKNMENLDSYMKELAGEMSELVEDMDSSEKNMLKTRLQTLAQKIQ